MNTQPIILDGRPAPLSQAVEDAVRAGKDIDVQFRSGLIDTDRRDDFFADALNQVAKVLGFPGSDGLVFTSSGSEAINMAIKGLAWGAEKNRTEVVVAEGDPEGFLESALWCEQFGFKKVTLPLAVDGGIDYKAATKLVGFKTAVVAISSVTPEVAVVRDLEKLSEICRSFNTPLALSLDLELPIRFPLQALKWGDVITLDGEAIGGPAGSGLFTLRPNVQFAPLISGGATQSGRRGGGFPLGLAMGFAAALEASTASPRRMAMFSSLRDAAWQFIIDQIPWVIFPKVAESLPIGLSFIVPGVEGEAVVMLCAQEKVFISTGSACSKRAGKASAVLTAIGFTAEEASGAIHLTFRSGQTVDEIRRGIEVIGLAVGKLRKIGSIDN